MFDFPPVGGDDRGGEVVRDLVGQRNYRRRPGRGEGSDRELKEHQKLDPGGALRRLWRRARRVLR